MLTVPTPLLVLGAIVLFPLVLVGSIALDALEVDLEARPAR
ncbi:hypothetical protein [Myxococcus dinghuensis]|nr:hypothetical protein [Myxococcus dinghuensis]